MTSVQSISQTATDFKDKYMDTDPAQSGEEPVSGVQGKGTATDPYDAGNSTDPAPALSGEEPPSGFQGKGTSTDPFDGGNAPENTPKVNAQATDTSSQSTATATSNEAATPSDAVSKAANDRGRDSLAAPARKPSERDISPGTLPDGTHAKTSGDRGESYEPGRMSKFKGKLGLGKH